MAFVQYFILLDYNNYVYNDHKCLIHTSNTLTARDVPTLVVIGSGWPKHHSATFNHHSGKLCTTMSQ